MNYEEILNYIHSLGKFRLPAGLDRIKKVCKKLGDPQDKLNIIHIAGTNGKGSVATMTAEILKESGKRVGLYISPFVVDFCERIQICGKYISKDDLVKYSKAVIDTEIELNEFEFITAVAFDYFYEQGVDVVVLETGLGGRLDATNVIKNPLVSVITRIGLDHTAVLGETIEEITAEKCGIIKNDFVVTMPNQDERALAVIKKYAKNVIVPKTPKIISSNISGNKFLFEGREYELSLLGVHQIYNAVTAIKAVEKSGFPVSYETVEKALKNTMFPARLEIVNDDPLTIIDGAHNPDGANALSLFLKTNPNSATIIIAMMRDKNCDEFLKIILPFAKDVIVTKIDNPRCMDVDELCILAQKYSDKVKKTSILKDAIKTAKTSKNPVFIVGSLYLASEARKYYK